MVGTKAEMKELRRDKTKIFSSMLKCKCSYFLMPTNETQDWKVVADRFVVTIQQESIHVLIIILISTFLGTER